MMPFQRGADLVAHRRQEDRLGAGASLGALGRFGVLDTELLEAAPGDPDMVELDAEIHHDQRERGDQGRHRAAQLLVGRRQLGAILDPDAGLREVGGVEEPLRDLRQRHEFAQQGVHALGLQVGPLQRIDQRGNPQDALARVLRQHDDVGVLPEFAAVMVAREHRPAAVEDVVAQRDVGAPLRREPVLQVTRDGAELLDLAIELIGRPDDVLADALLGRPMAGAERGEGRDDDHAQQKADPEQGQDAEIVQPVRVGALFHARACLSSSRFSAPRSS